MIICKIAIWQIDRYPFLAEWTIYAGRSICVTTRDALRREGNGYHIECGNAAYIDAAGNIAFCRRQNISRNPRQMTTCLYCPCQFRQHMEIFAHKKQAADLENPALNRLFLQKRPQFSLNYTGRLPAPAGRPGLPTRTR